MLLNLPVRRPRLPIACALASLLASSLGAQIIRVPKRSSEPAAWVGFSIGAFQAQDVADGTTASYWQFGGTTSFQWRGELMKSFGRGGSSFGVTGTLTRIGFTWQDISSSVDGTPDPAAGERCSSCDAHMQIAFLGVGVHAGGGLGFHQVIDVSLGATRYGNLTADAGGAKLAPKKGDIDGSLALGYGIGYTVRSTLEIGIVQDYSFVLHQRENLPRDASTYLNQRATRLFVRQGLGRRKSKF